MGSADDNNHISDKVCCAPDRAGVQTDPEAKSGDAEVEVAGPSAVAGVAGVDGGVFEMGTEGPQTYVDDGEDFVHTVEVSAFELDIYAVTNDRFAEFVTNTGFVTDAERYQWSFVFGGLLPEDFDDTRGVAAAPWWRQVFGADWSHPEGPDSGIVGRGDHPVIHVSHNDARTFCAWAGGRLPTEAEWEYAARGGLTGVNFPWGDELEPVGQHKMNVWQGSFPDANSNDDGFYGTAPVDSFVPNRYGLFNMTGNVWEWCSDWFSPDYYTVSPSRDPKGPSTGQARVMRGGSFLCHASYCHRYRVGARSSNGPDSSSGNLGFRVARNHKPIEGENQ